jgi:hypothetical protein
MLFPTKEHILLQKKIACVDLKMRLHRKFTGRSTRHRRWNLCLAARVKCSYLTTLFHGVAYMFVIKSILGDFHWSCVSYDSFITLILVKPKGMHRVETPCNQVNAIGSCTNNCICFIMQIALMDSLNNSINKSHNNMFRRPKGQARQ